MWTHFMDMHSGGGLKEQWQHIYIEAPEEEAISVFYARFGHNPHRVTCTCCGSDYSIDEHPSLEQASGYERNCEYDSEAKAYIEVPATKRHMFTQPSYTPVDIYAALPSIHVIRAADIRPDERSCAVPEQGYIWAD